MMGEDLTPEQWQIFWEVKEFFPQASPAMLKQHIHLGVDDLVRLCSEGGVTMDDAAPIVTEEDIDLKRALAASKTEHEQVFRRVEPPTLIAPVGRANATIQQMMGQDMRHPQHAIPPRHMSAPATAPAPRSLIRPPVVVQPTNTEHNAATAAAPCNSCGGSQPSAQCQPLINQQPADDDVEKDSGAHSTCARCLKGKFMAKLIRPSTRKNAIHCPMKTCNRFIGKRRLLLVLQKPALVDWMVGLNSTIHESKVNYTHAETVRRRNEESELTEEERDRYSTIIDMMNRDEFAQAVDVLSDVCFTWILNNIDRGMVNLIAFKEKEELSGNIIPFRRWRRRDKRGISNLIEERLTQTTFECAVCMEECKRHLMFSCVQIPSGNQGAEDAPPSTHSFCVECIRGQARVAVEQNTIAPGGLGLKCMQPNCKAVLLYAHIEPVIEAAFRERLEENIAAEALKAAAVNVERCQRCPFAMIMDLPPEQQPAFACRRCGFEYCRSCDREWTQRHVGKTCEELNPEFVRRKVENELSDQAVTVLQRCPSCSSPFEKNGGCDNMHCRCGASFRYAGLRAMDNAQRANIIQRHINEAGDDTVAEELRKIQ